MSSQASAEVREKRMQAASEAAAEINASLEAKNNASSDEVLKTKPHDTAPEAENNFSSVGTGVLIHWSTVRGFGILKSQSHGEINVRAKSFANAPELAVGDVVTFELGFDQKKNKPEAINCCKTGSGGSSGPDSLGNLPASVSGEAGSAAGESKAKANAGSVKSAREIRGKSESEQQSNKIEKVGKKSQKEKDKQKEKSKKNKKRQK